jgi:hypothetical protein
MAMPRFASSSSPRAVAIDHRVAGAVGGGGVVHPHGIGIGPGHLIFAVGRAASVPRHDRRAGLHAQRAPDDGGAVRLVQERDGDVRVELPQLEVRPVEDMPIVVVVTAGAAREADAVAVDGGVDPRGKGEVAAIVADGGVPGRRRFGTDVEPVAVVQDAQQVKGAVLDSAAIAQRPHPDGEARDQAQLHHRGVDVAHQDADIGFGGPIGLRLPDHL